MFIEFNYGILFNKFSANHTRDINCDNNTGRISNAPN